MESEKIILILGAIIALSESLALIPKLKSNSVLTLIGNIGKKLKELLSSSKKIESLASDVKKEIKGDNDSSVKASHTNDMFK